MIQVKTTIIHNEIGLQKNKIGEEDDFVLSFARYSKTAYSQSQMFPECFTINCYNIHRLVLYENDKVKCTETHNAGWTGDSIQHW